jgi:hypothetical protein
VRERQAGSQCHTPKRRIPPPPNLRQRNPLTTVRTPPPLYLRCSTRKSYNPGASLHVQELLYFRSILRVSIRELWLLLPHADVEPLCIFLR